MTGARLPRSSFSSAISSRLLHAEMLSMNFKFQDVPDNQSAVPYRDICSLHYRSRHTIYRHCLQYKI